MAIGTTSTGTSRPGSVFRILCGCLTLGLSLLCVFASFGHAITMSGRDALSLWVFFVWGTGLAIAGVWLIRGRSKGKAIVFAWDRRRIITVSLMAILVVGLLIFLVNQPSVADDAIWWPLILQTMFANLFASLPFLLFDREDYKERNAPVQLDSAQRRKVRRRAIFVAVAGALMFVAGIAAGQQVDSWLEDILVQAGTAVLAAAVAVGYRLRKTRPRDSVRDYGSSPPTVERED
jgi:hypothetical protein